MMRAIQTRAPTRSRKILEGTSNTKYPMKNKPAPKSEGCLAETNCLVHLELGEADIDAVQISNEIAHDQKWDQAPHHFADHALFDVHGVPFRYFYFLKNAGTCLQRNCGVPGRSGFACAATWACREYLRYLPRSSREDEHLLAGLSLTGNPCIIRPPPTAEMTVGYLEAIHMLRRDFLKAAGAIAGTVSIHRTGIAAPETVAGAQIRLVVPFPAGGPTDIVARPFAQIWVIHSRRSRDRQPRRGRRLIGADTVAKSAPDGRTLLMGTVGTHAINSALYKKLPYDAVRDFTPIALVAMAPVTIVVHPSQPVSNIAELVALAKRMPGKLNYGSAGAGTPGHFTGEMFKTQRGSTSSTYRTGAARQP